MIYDNLIKNNDIIKTFIPTFNINFVNGPFVEIKNIPNKKFNVYFIDKEKNILEHYGEIKNNNWIKANKSYFINWKILITDDENTYEYNLDLSNSKVYIALDSKSLGDTLAWFPYVEEFRKKHNCRIICSTFWNNLFKEQYSEIEFIKPGENVSGLTAMYTIGWFYDGDKPNLNKHPKEFKDQPLQKTASDILGLDYKEIKSKIKLNKDIIDREKIISIAIHSTAQAKYWNNSDGWQQVVNYLKEKGYKILLLSQEEDGYMGNNHPIGIEQFPKGPIENIIEILQKSTLFIGIGSGLSWLSLATNTPTAIISGFSEPYTEFQNGAIRISSPDNVCTGCFNKFKLNAGDWNWCPIHKGTNRQFECSKSITSDFVIKCISPFI